MVSMNRFMVSMNRVIVSWCPWLMRLLSSEMNGMDCPDLTGNVNSLVSNDLTLEMLFKWRGVRRGKSCWRNHSTSCDWLLCA